MSDDNGAQQGINYKLVNLLVVIVIVFLITMLALKVVPMVTQKANEGGQSPYNTAKKVGKAVTDPYLDKGADEIYALLVRGGEKKNMGSMNPLERKMLHDVVSEIAKEGVPIEEATDASKFVVKINEGGEPHVHWMILYRDVDTGKLTQVIAFQVGYSSKSGVLATHTESKPTWDYQTVIMYGIPSRLTFNDRTSE